MQRKRNAESDQDGAQKKCEAHAEEKADSSMSLGPGFFRRKNAHRRFLLAKHRAENRQISDEPEFYFVTRLPEQIESRTDDQDTDNPQKLGHD
jgi:hypothetical protein